MTGSCTTGSGVMVTTQQATVLQAVVQWLRHNRQLHHGQQHDGDDTTGSCAMGGSMMATT